MKIRVFNKEKLLGKIFCLSGLNIVFYSNQSKKHFDVHGLTEK